MISKMLWIELVLWLTVAFTNLGCSERDVSEDAQIGYSGGRPLTVARMNATDHGAVLRHGQCPDDCDIFGARDVWVFEYEGQYLMHYDGAGINGWKASLAVSNDLINWEKRGYILKLGDEGYDDAGAACYGTVFHDGDGWHMYYLGTPNTSKKPYLIPSFPYNTLKATADSPYGPWEKQYGVSQVNTVEGTYYSTSASPGFIVKDDAEYMQFISVSDDYLDRTLAIARTSRLDSDWILDEAPILPASEQIENSSIYYEEQNKTWFLFTNHVGIDDEGLEYSDAVLVYWTKDLNKWSSDNKAIVLDSQNSTWSKKVIGLPSVVRHGNRLAIFYDGRFSSNGGDDTSLHMYRDIGLAWIDLPLSPPFL
ncbi:MAG: hypothetical protein HQL49_06715 [Gammaproteobacteria bacterium]|nr:hypothetical protein [Gammaproteobacteria bacterium]